MSSQWEKAPLEELTEDDSPITYGVVKPGTVGDVLFVRGGDLSNGRILHSQLRTITKEISDQYKRTLLRGNELLVSLVGQPGQVAVVPSALAGANIARQVGLVRLRSGIDANFISYFLQSPDGRKALGTYTGGSVQQVINLCDLRTVDVPIPPLSEQQQIVALVDNAFEGIDRAIANTEKNLANAHELFESYLNTVFIQKGDGWVDTVIEDHIKFIDYRGRTPNKTEEGMRLITAKNVKMGFLQTEPQEFVNPDIYEKWMTRGIPLKGDVLFTTEAPLGNVAQLDTCEKVVFAQRVIIMQPDPKALNSTFLKFILLSKTMQQRIQEKGTGATAQGIKASLLKKIQISFPVEISTQEDIVSKLEEIGTHTQRLEAIYYQKLSALNELKQSILQKAFTGELTADTTSQTTRTAEEVIAA